MLSDRLSIANNVWSIIGHSNNFLFVQTEFFERFFDIRGDLKANVRMWKHFRFKCVDNDLKMVAYMRPYCNKGPLLAVVGPAVGGSGYHIGRCGLKQWFHVIKADHIHVV